jgi:hypothetical protein
MACIEDQAEMVAEIQKMIAAAECGELVGAAIAAHYKDGRYETLILGEYAENPVQAAGVVAVLQRELVDNAIMDRPTKPCAPAASGGESAKN